MEPWFKDDPYYRLMQLIDATHIKSRKFAERKLKTLNMTYPQFAALMVLHTRDGIKQRQLADLMETDTTTVMVLCNSLEKRKWVNRKTVANDRRLKLLFLTDTGKSVYQEALEILHAGLRFMHENTPADEIDRAIPFLEQLHGNINSLLEGKAQ